MSFYKRSDFSGYMTKTMNEQRTLRKSLGAVQKPRVFLSHSHLDDALVAKVINFFQAYKAAVYVDWMDDGLPSETNRETAEILKAKIANSPRFIVLATDNSLKSRWMPWELGFADSKLQLANIAILAIAQEDGVFLGNEYLQLYSRIIASNHGEPAVFGPNTQSGTLLSAWL